MTANSAIQALRNKTGIPNSINPNFHADTLQEVYDDAKELSSITQRTVTQTAHGFTSVDVDAGTFLSGQTGTYVLADIDDLATTADCMLIEVVDVNTIVVASEGYWTKTSHGFAQGIYYLAQDGEATLNVPTTGYTQEVLRVMDSGTLKIGIGQPEIQGISDAPADGRQYARQDNAWEVVSSSGGSQVVSKAITTDGTGQYINLIKWDALSAGTNDAAAFDCILMCYDSSGKFVFETKLEGFLDRVSNDANITITTRTSDYPTEDTEAEYRWAKADASQEAEAYLQFKTGLDGTYTWRMSNELNDAYSSDVTFGDLVIRANTGTELEIETLDVSNWQSRFVSSHFKGIATPLVGAVDAGSYSTFTNSEATTFVGEQAIIKASNTGTRFSAGEYGTWGTDSPEPAFPTNSLSSVTNTKRPTNDDTTGNPLSTVTCNLSDASTGSGLIRWDSIDGYAIIRLVGNTVTNRGCMRHRFDGATIGQKIRVTHKWWKAADAVMEHTARLGGPEGQTLKVLTLPSSNPNSTFYTTDFEYTVTTEDALRGYADIFLSNTGSGTTGYYLYSYRVDIVVDEPPLQTNVVSQFDSVYRGILLPRIVPVSSDEHTQGAIALNELGMRNPVYYNGDNWSNFAVTRNDTADVQYGTYYSSELGTGVLEDQGFEQTTGTKMTVVQDHQGFPQLLRTNANSTVSIFSTIDDTDEFWQAAWDRGLVVTHRVMAADTSRELHMNIEPRNNSTSWGTGRFTYNITNNSSGDSVLELERANGGSGTLEVPITKNVMHTINVIIPPSTGVATVILNGQVVGMAGLGGYDGQRGICTFTVGGAAGDYYLQQYGITVMEATATAKTFTVKEITDSIRYVIPTTANDFALTMPKSLMPVGTTFTVVNGGSREATIKGAEDDLQLFGGDTIGRIPAGEECTLVQTGFPTGNIWTMSNRTARRTPTSQGHSLHLKVNSSGDIVNRHGTYTADDVQVTRPSTGDYQIAVGGHVFTSTNFLITAIADGSNTAAREYFTSAGLGAIGEAGVWFRDTSGVARNTAFNVSIYW